MVSSALMAVVMVLPGQKALVESLGATDSMSRTRAAYALARVHDPADGTDAAAMQRILDAGLVTERVAAARGLLARGTRLTSDQERKVIGMLSDPEPEVRAAVIHGLRLLSRDRAVELLTEEEPKSTRRAKANLQPLILLELHRLGADTAKDLIRRDYPGFGFQMWKERCTLEGCLDALAMAAWLGEDVSPVTKRYTRDDTSRDWVQELMLRRIEAAGGSESALAALTSAARKTVDTSIRRKVFAWILDMPAPAAASGAAGLHRDVIATVIGAVDDPDPVIHQRAIEIVSESADTFRGWDIETTLAGSLRNGDIDTRLAAALGLHECGVSRDSVGGRALAAQAEGESDAVVRAAIAAALANAR